MSERTTRARVTLAALFFTACATQPVDEVDDDGRGGAPATTSAGGDAMGGGGAGGAPPGPCGTDCSTIQAPQCHKAVCNEGMHPGPVGSCVVVPDDDGVSCDDGQFCTTNDTCQAGACVGGPPNDCGMDPDACEEVVCDEAVDACTTAPLPNGTACVSDDLCLLGATCTNGLCAGGTEKDCFFAPVPNECHAAVCDPDSGMCEPVPANDGMGCTDVNDLCTIDKTCNAGACTGGIPKDCSQLTVGCDLGVCDTGTGQCMAQSVGDGQLCDDLDACTSGEICTAGTCGGGSPVTTCSLTSDGCCPANCTEVNDYDCNCFPGSITTTFAAGNSQSGNMFDVVALKSVEIQGVSVHMTSGTATIEVYYRPGSYVGFENSSAGWTLAGTAANVVAAGSGQPTPVPLNLSIPIPAGQTYALYITRTSGSLSYTNGTTVGSVYTSNQDIQVREGLGKGYPFGANNSPRVFNGILHYEQCGN